MRIKSIYDNDFRYYGQVLTGYDFTELFNALKMTALPEKGIEYIASVHGLEKCRIFQQFKDRGFGGLPIQMGSCCGYNDTLNCMEYHKSSEFNIAMDDIILFLGHQWDIRNGVYDTSCAEAFHVPAGVGIEMYATTLHYAPCGYYGSSFRVACVLPVGTNIGMPEIDVNDSAEDKMCTGTNKWLISHRDSNEAENGAYVGLEGVNIQYRH